MKKHIMPILTMLALAVVVVLCVMFTAAMVVVGAVLAGFLMLGTLYMMVYEAWNDDGDDGDYGF